MKQQEWNKCAGGEIAEDIKGWEEKEWEEKLPGGPYKPHGCAEVKSKV